MNRIRLFLVFLALMVLCSCLGVLAEETEAEIDHHARAELAFSRARRFFNEVSEAAEGTLQRSASAAASGAADAASAAKNRHIADAINSANRSKLDALLAAASINAHKDIDRAVRRFDAQVAELEAAPEDQKPQQLARVAERLTAIARALRDATTNDD